MSRMIVVPSLRLSIGGVPLSDEQRAALGEVRVRQELSLPAQCEVVFHGASFDVDALLRPARAVRVEVEGGAAVLFDGEATAVEYVYGPSGEREVRVRAYDVLHRLRKRQTVRAHVQLTPLELASELAAPLGLSVEGAEAGPVRGRLIQHRQSDLELLAEATGPCGLYFSLRGDVLHVCSLRGIDAGPRLVLGDGLIEARVEVNGEAACEAVRAEGIDLLGVRPHAGESRSPRIGRRVRAGVAPADVGGSGTTTLVGEAVESDRHVEALAQGALDLRAAHAVTFWGVAEGDPLLRPGTTVDLAGLDDALDGRHVLTSVVHTIDPDRGYLSEISSRPPAPRPRPKGTVATLGLVTRVDDPDGLGRIRVTLPAYGAVETGWLQVVAAGAGPGKGLTALPDVDDRVVVLLSEEDLGRGVVLGGLYGSEGAPDPGVEGNAVRRYTLRTPGGHVVRLDDAAAALRVEDATGSFVEFTPDGATLHAAVDLTLEAPGRNVRIRGRHIDFEQA